MKWKDAAIIYFVIAVIPLVALPSAVSVTPTEYQVKAAFLYYFAEFIEWPGQGSGNKNGAFVIGILGQDPFGSDIEQTLRGKTVKGRELLIRRFMDHNNLKDCDILFISASEKERLTEIFDSLDHAKVLTVGDTDGFASLGGIINFVIENNRVHFEVNLKAASRAGLKISSKLLNVATVLED